MQYRHIILVFYYYLTFSVSQFHYGTNITNIHYCVVIEDFNQSKTLLRLHRGNNSLRFSSNYERIDYGQMIVKNLVSDLIMTLSHDSFS